PRRRALRYGRDRRPPRCRRTSRRVRRRCGGARSSPFCRGADRTRSSSPCSRGRAPRLPGCSLPGVASAFPCSSRLLMRPGAAPCQRGSRGGSVGGGLRGAERALSRAVAELNETPLGMEARLAAPVAPTVTHVGYGPALVGLTCLLVLPVFFF